MRLAIAAASLVLVGCGIEEPKPSPIPPQVVDRDFTEIVSEFERDLGVKVNSTVIWANTPDLKYIGVCHFLPRREIRIAPKLRSYPSIMLKVVLYHEMGHCDLNLEHTKQGDWTLTDPYTYSSEYRWYEANWNYLVNDLRRKKTEGPFINFSGK